MKSTGNIMLTAFTRGRINNYITFPSALKLLPQYLPFL